MASSTARALLSSSVTSLSLGACHRKLQPSPPFSHHLLLVRPLLPSAVSTARRRDVASCLISGVDGGGVSDDFVSTRKSGFSREFSVIANMLKRIEPLDVSVISQGVSDAAKDSMKQTISTMLGLLPSDQFSVTIRVSKSPLDRLMVSSIITGYTLWNAEYRVLLMRNFDLSLDDTLRHPQMVKDGAFELNGEDGEGEMAESRHGRSLEDSEGMSVESLESLSPQVSSYIQHLELELSSVKQELDTCKQQNIEMEQVKRSNNNLLEYLRSLESDMVTELSRPSSSEVNDFIHQLSQNILQKFFKEDIVTNHAKDPPPGIRRIGKFNDGVEEYLDDINTSRDYLAKLLFWCMLLGHHLRALENRLHLSCAVGLL